MMRRRTVGPLLALITFAIAPSNARADEAGVAQPGVAPPTVAPPTVAPAGADAASADAGAATPSDVRFIAGFAAAAFGGSMVVLFGIAQSRISEIENNPSYDRYRAGFKTWESVCDRADQGVASPVMGSMPPLKVRSVCSEAETWEIVSYVSLPLGIAALGAGAVLVAGSATVGLGSASLTSDDGGVSVSVVPTPGGAALVGQF
jgi:hypothetical protein